MTVEIPRNLKTFYAQSRISLRRDGHLTPALLVEGSERVLAAFPQWRRELAPQLLYHAGQQFAHLKPWRVAWTGEAYFRLSSADEPPADRPFADLPDAREVLILTWATADGGEFMAMQAIEKDVQLAKTRIRFGAVEVHEAEAFMLRPFFEGVKTA